MVTDALAELTQGGSVSMEATTEVALVSVVEQQPGA